MVSDRIFAAPKRNPRRRARPPPTLRPSPLCRPGSGSLRCGTRSPDTAAMTVEKASRPTGAASDARLRRQHAPGRPDRLPLDPHVGPAVPGRDAVRRLHDGRRAGLEPLEPHHGRGVVRRRHVHARRVQAHGRIRARFGPGDPLRRRHHRGDEDPRHRGLDAGLAGARAHQGGDVPERLARRQGRRRHHRPVPRLVLVPGRAALAPQTHPGRRAGDGGGAAPPGAALASPRPRPGAGREASPALQHRRHPVSGAHRDPAHHRLGHHRIGQDRADRRSRLADPRPGRALRDLRQDGERTPGRSSIPRATC